MGSALVSGLSGLRVHQAYLDVIGNNLANASTPGFRGSRITFSDLLSQIQRTGSAPTGNLGGQNPVQIGLGVQVHTIDVRMAQGVLNDTGRPFDLGIQGEGFFVLNGGGRNLYTRAGFFGLDSNSFMVDSGSGARVRSVTGSDIQLPLNTILPPRATGNIELGGNLPALVTGPVAEELTTSAGFQEGTNAQLQGANTEPFDLEDGWSFELNIDGKAPVSVDFDVADGLIANIDAVTAAEAAAQINLKITAAGGGAVAADVAGQVVITSDRTGLDASLRVTDVAGGSPATALGLSSTLVTGTESDPTAATLLNDLADNVTDYVAGDQIEISGTDAAGQALAGTFVFGTDGTTLGELVTFIDGLVTDATATLDASGNIVVTANQEGEASLSLSLSDGSAAQAGQSNFSSHAFTTTTEGKGPDQMRTSIDVFDTRGLRHTLTMTFTRIDDVEWNMAVTTGDSNDILTDDSINGIRFNPDGSFSSVTGTGVGDLGIEIQFDGLAASQQFDVGLGTSGEFNGVTQLGDTTSLRAVSQDGFGAGDLITVSVNSDGVIEGGYSNGQSQALDQIAIATFANPGGLERAGGSTFRESPNSGVAQLQAAGSGSAGTVFSGVLEASNVDTAEEFVRLIQAQRGFQANARVIRVADELLVELVNLV